MGIETIIGILVIVPAFYFLGKWLNKSEKEVIVANLDKTLESSTIATPENKITTNLDRESIKYWVVGVGVFVFIGVVLYFLFWLDSRDRLTPEEQAKIETKKQLYLQDIKHCQAVIGTEVININNAEFQRCNALLQDFENNASSDSGRHSGPYEY
ncbi:MAG: hypothetical protein HYV65_01295 [Candidatus Spechtbacteria bacterium]|nr:hypothetical protein [Candidatus Spechtbacteria bacterium]